MKALKILVVVAGLFLCQSCATVFGGKVTEYQRTKPEPGEVQRKVRIVPLVLDILLFPPAVVVDFATGAIYKKEKATNNGQ